MWKLSNEVLLDNLDNWNQHGRTAMPWYEHKKLIHFYVIFASIKAFYAILFIFKSFYWWFLLIFKVMLLIIFTIFLDHNLNPADNYLCQRFINVVKSEGYINDINMGPFVAHYCPPVKSWKLFFPSHLSTDTTKYEDPPASMALVVRSHCSKGQWALLL
jgi:hypothetical protein